MVKPGCPGVDPPGVEWVRFQLEPRDQHRAARTASLIYLISAIVVLISAALLLVPDQTSSAVRQQYWWTVAMCVPLVVIGMLLAWPRFPHTSLLLLLSPVAGVGFALAITLTTSDSSAAGQVTFCLPVLFAASQLRFLGAAITVVAAIGGDIVLVLQLKPTVLGAVDVLFVGFVLLLMTGLLVVAGQRQDRLVAQLESQASLDTLTGLVTRRVLDEAMRRALTSPPEHPGTALILVDVDHFKSINDTYGHPVGDDALVHVAEVLRRQARPDSVISRLGGDEIAVLLPGCAEAVARERAQEFLRSMRASPLVLSNGRPLGISISIGVAHAPGGEMELRELYAAADASLYEAKRAGRGRIGRSGSGHPALDEPPAVPAQARH